MGKETVDFRRAERYAKTVTGTYDQRAKFQGLLHSAWRTITHAAVWQQITSLADALETYGELSGAALVPWKREAQRIARRYDLTLALRK
jgi:hypothetical protein